MRTLQALVATVVILAGVAVNLGAAQSTMEQCTSTIKAMTGCLPYASAKAPNPTQECCTVVLTTVQHNKDCLCKFIAMVHQGSPEITSLGVQEAKLIQLPSACNLKNVSASNCPKLAPSSSPVVTNGTAVNDVVSTGGGYKMHGVVSLEAVVLVVMVAFLFPFPEGLRLGTFV